MLSFSYSKLIFFSSDFLNSDVLHSKFSQKCQWVTFITYVPHIGSLGLSATYLDSSVIFPFLCISVLCCKISLLSGLLRAIIQFSLVNILFCFATFQSQVIIAFSSEKSFLCPKYTLLRILLPFLLKGCSISSAAAIAIRPNCTVCSAGLPQVPYRFKYVVTTASSQFRLWAKETRG